MRSCNDRLATSETNLQIVGRQYERFNQRRIGALIAALDADVVFEPGPEAGPYRAICVGRGEVKQFFKRLSKTVRKFQAQPLRVLEQGDEVFVLVRMYGRFKGGIEAWLPVIHRDSSGREDRGLAELSGQGDGVRSGGIGTTEGGPSSTRGNA